MSNREKIQEKPFNFLWVFLYFLSIFSKKYLHQCVDLWYYISAFRTVRRLSVCAKMVGRGDETAGGKN